jgi:phenylpropionate dioxygenase-like ring-hydroxylating dioxygenase large terminal subunit
MKHRVLRNAWYVAEASSVLTNNLHGVRILGEEVLLYRKEDGEVAALENACPHRKVPLSLGKRRGDFVECAYHGLTFDASGSCVRVPGAESIPKRARVHSYPVAERFGLIWIWMGDAALADPRSIFQVDHWGDPEWGCTPIDSMVVECNYLYITDNLLDPSHVAWVHPTSFGNSACAETPLKLTVLANGVAVSRWMLDVEVAPFYAKFVKFAGNADRQQHYEVRFPSNAIIRAVFAPAGSGGPHGLISADTFLMDSYNFMTPIDENTTRYFWFQMRNVAPRDEQVSAAFAKAVRTAFEEDKVILEAVHKGMQHAGTSHIDLASDAGPTRFRLRLAAMIRAEEEVLSVG